MKGLAIATGVLLCCLVGCGTAEEEQAALAIEEATPTPVPNNSIPLEAGTFADVRACTAPPASSHALIARYSHCTGTVEKVWPHD
jgi:hypothetical protein